MPPNQRSAKSLFSLSRDVSKGPNTNKRSKTLRQFFISTDSEIKYSQPGLCNRRVGALVLMDNWLNGRQWATPCLHSFPRPPSPFTSDQVTVTGRSGSKTTYAHLRPLVIKPGSTFDQRSHSPSTIRYLTNALWAYLPLATLLNGPIMYQ